LAPFFQQATAGSARLLGSNRKSKWKNWRWKGGDGDAALGGQMPGGELQPPFLCTGVESWREKGAPRRWRNLLFSAREWGVGGRRGRRGGGGRRPAILLHPSERNGKVRLRHSGDREKHPVLLHSIGEKKEDALVAAMEGGWKAVFFLSDFMNLRQIHSTATTKG
jgi:hypothetical protein